MPRRAYYNDVDPFCAAWLRELIKRRLIPDGEVDERSIVDVRSDDLRGFGQCHFFAGISGWGLAGIIAGVDGWPDWWSASAPCPPFSVAGKKLFCPECASGNLVWCPRRAGFAICADCRHAWFADGRHLWPEVWRLVAERRPSRIVGEQVASRQALDAWFPGVRGSLEICGYAVGAANLPACSVNAPHLRERLFWCAAMADANSERTHARGGDDQTARHGHSADAAGCADDGMADAESLGRGRRQDDENRGRGQLASADSDARGVAQGDAFGSGLERQRGHVDDGREPGRDREGAAESTAATGAGVEHAEGDRRGKGRSEHELWNGRSTVASAIGWDDAAWFTGADGKTRRVPRSLEPRVRGLVARLSAGMDPGWFGSGAETVPLLAQGVTNRIGLLRGYGNAIVPAVAAEFIKAVMECMP